MLSEGQCMKIETGLTEDVEPRKVAAYLCFHMGFSVAEVTALRLGDIDFDAGTITIRNLFARPEGSDNKTSAEFVHVEIPRTLPMPPHVQRYLSDYRYLYANGDCFILTGETELPAFYHLQNVLSSICVKYKIANTLSATQLRNNFIRRCIQSGIDLYSLCAYIGIKQPNVLVKKYAAYFTPHLDAVNVLEKFSAGYMSPEPALKSIPIEPKRMNLLILGAGSQGPVVKEIAEAIGVFNEIAYLDDEPSNRLAIDSCENYKRYVNRFPIAIPSFGDCELRANWTNLLEKAGFILPVLVHPMATISPSARLSEAVVIEAKAIISASVMVERNCIISSGAVLDKGSKIGANTHLGCSSTITKDSIVPSFSRIPAGMVYGLDK